MSGFLNLGLGLGSKQAPVAAAAAGGTTYIHDPLTDNSQVTPDGGWTYGANGATRGSGDGTTWSLEWGTKDTGNLNPETWDSLSVSVTIHATGTDVWVSMFALADGTRLALIQDCYYVQWYSGSNLIRIFRRTGAANVIVANTTLAALQAGDTLKLTVTRNGSNYDVAAFVNDSELLSVSNDAHAGSLGRQTVLGSQNPSGKTSTYKNLLAVAT